MRIDRKAFKEWLLGCDPYQIVGSRAMADDCPLARFTGQPVTTDRWDEDGYYVLTGWACEFARGIDFEPGPHGEHYSSYGEHITAWEALMVLEGV